MIGFRRVACQLNALFLLTSHCNQAKYCFGLQKLDARKGRWLSHFSEVRGDGDLDYEIAKTPVSIAPAGIYKVTFPVWLISRLLGRGHNGVRSRNAES